MNINETIVRNGWATNHVHRRPESQVTMRSDLERAARNVAEESARLADVARQIFQKVQEAAATGERVISVQKEMTFVTGSYARLVKDFGIMDHLQMKGARLPKRLENGALK